MIGRGFSAAMRSTTTSSKASYVAMCQGCGSKFCGILKYLDGGKTQERSGFNIVDYVDKLLDRRTSVVLTREIWVRNKVQPHL